MSVAHLMHDLEQDLGSVPMIDVHTHLVGGGLGARGLHDVLLDHMVISDHEHGKPAEFELAGEVFGIEREDLFDGLQDGFGDKGRTVRPLLDLTSKQAVVGLGTEPALPQTISNRHWNESLLGTFHEKPEARPPVWRLVPSDTIRVSAALEATWGPCGGFLGPAADDGHSGRGGKGRPRQALADHPGLCEVSGGDPQGRPASPVSSWLARKT